jgi:trk system potassium uptake protein TrkA
MYVVILGAGRIGTRMAAWISGAGSEVTVIDRDKQRLKSLDIVLGQVGLLGDGSKIAVLDEAGASRADLFIATTGSDDVNLVACQIAKHRFSVGKTVSIVYNSENESLFNILGIDSGVSITDMVVERIELELADMFVEEV